MKYIILIVAAAIAADVPPEKYGDAWPRIPIEDGNYYPPNWFDDSSDHYFGDGQPPVQIEDADHVG
jgi:hypothetical protein